MSVDVVHSRLIPHWLWDDVNDVACSVKDSLGTVCIRQTGGLHESRRHIHAESVDAAIKPEANRLVEFCLHIWVIPVDVWLRPVKEVQVPVAGRCASSIKDWRPSITGEDALPVVRGKLVRLSATQRDVVAAPLC